MTAGSLTERSKVRYPRSKQEEQEEADRDTWPWVLRSIVERCGKRRSYRSALQQPEGIEASAEWGYRPEATLIRW